MKKEEKVTKRDYSSNAPRTEPIKMGKYDMSTENQFLMKRGT
jgi:hypothetical protein